MYECRHSQGHQGAVVRIPWLLAPSSLAGCPKAMAIRLQQASEQPRELVKMLRAVLLPHFLIELVWVGT